MVSCKNDRTKTDTGGSVNFTKIRFESLVRNSANYAGTLDNSGFLRKKA